MDRISQLSDELLLKILSLLPTAKHVVSTMVLSKRWQFLWMSVPKLVCDDSFQNPEYGKFSRFVDRLLLLHEAPVIETLHFKLGTTCGSGDIRTWIGAADKCILRELIIEIKDTPVTLPRRLYTGGCRMLVTLNLCNATLVDFTSPPSFPSLKNLSLVSIKYPSDEFVKTLLSNCHVLEDLVVIRTSNDNVTIFTIRVPSLKRLVLHKLDLSYLEEDCRFLIDALSVESLDIVDHVGVIENNMTKIIEAIVCTSYADTDQFMSSISSVKQLYLCLPSSKNAYPVGSVFHHLLHLRISTCDTEWLNLLLFVLRDSPNLRSLKLRQCHILQGDKPRPCWNEPSSVPACVISSLESLEWVKYEGTKEEKEIASFILRNGRCLKKVTIIPHNESTDIYKKFEMIKELAMLPRPSPSCQLVFD